MGTVQRKEQKNGLHFKQLDELTKTMSSVCNRWGLGLRDSLLFPVVYC